MTENAIEFAWAIPVKVEVLGAHLEAYSNLQSLMNTLRLCNRFGRGEYAFITKLPVEMIHQVEGYLMDAERSKLRGRWAKNLRCWEHRCRPIAHLGPDDILEMYNDLRADMEWVDCCPNCGLAHELPETEVTPWVRECVGEFLDDVFSDTGEGGRWLDGHNLRVETWLEYVGAPTSKDRGKLGQLSSILSKHFGVELWVSHAQEKEEARFPTANNVRSTKAYLRLADKFVVQHDVLPNYDDYEGEPMRAKTEAGYAGALVLPTQPTDKSLTRFARAVKILNLDYSKSRSSTTPAATTEDKSTSDESVPEKASSKNANYVQPKLTMFVRSNDETSDY